MGKSNNQIEIIKVNSELFNRALHRLNRIAKEIEKYRKEKNEKLRGWEIDLIILREEFLTSIDLNNKKEMYNDS